MFAFVADRKIKAKMAVQFAGLAGQPRERYVEGPLRTGAVAVKTYIIFAACLDAHIAVPSEASCPGRVETITLSHQSITIVVEDTAMVNQYIAIDAEQAVIGCIDAYIATYLAGEA